MASNYKRIVNGLQLVGKSASTVSLAGEVEFLSSSGKLNLHNGSVASPIVTEISTATLTNKTIDAGSNTITNLANANIANAAAIAYSKLNLTGNIVNADISASAAIAYSKLNLTGSVVNADIGASAAIAYSKLNLAGSVVNADIASGAAIAYSKLSLAGAVQNSDLAAAVSIAKGGTGQTSQTTGFDALAPTTTKGDIIVYNGTHNVRQAVGTDGQVAVADSSQTTGVKWATLNQGAKNYIQYSSFENGATTGWSTCSVTLSSSIPSGAPTIPDGSAHLTLSATSSSPLAGSFSLLVTMDGSQTNGEGFISNAFTIDTEDQAKMMGITFYYNQALTSPNFSGTSSNSWAVYIYDVTNSAWIQPAGVYNLVQSSGTGYCTATFQTTSNSTQYRLAIIGLNISSNTVGSTTRFDDFYAGPSRSPMGPAVTDWLSFTPTGSWSTNTTYTGFYRRKGDSADFIYQITLSGAPTSATLTLNLPSGLTIDTTKLISNTNFIQFGTIQGTGAAHGFSGFTQYNSSTTIAPVYLVDGSTASIQTVASITQAAPYTFANGDKIICFATDVPIVGWSSNTSMSSDTDTRVVAARMAITTGAQTITTGTTTQLAFDTAQFDTHGALTTGASAKFTAPQSGYYEISAIANYGLQTWTSLATDIALMVYKNGVLYSTISENGPTAAGSGCRLSQNGKDRVLLSAGDTLDIRVSHNDGSSRTVASGAGNTYVSIQRLSGPAVVAATESVNCRYRSTATQSIGGSSTQMNFDSKDFDSHSAVSNPSSAWTFTCPVSGKYRMNWALLTGSVALAANTRWEGTIAKNGSTWANIPLFVNETSRTGIMSLFGSGLVQCNAGDTLVLNTDQNCGTVSLSGGGTQNWIEIERIGN